MIKRMVPRANTTLAPIKKALFVLRPWTLPASTTGWQAHRDMIVHYRANPRSTRYMLERANEFISVHAQDASIDLLVYKDIVNEVPVKDFPWIKNLISDDKQNNLNPGQYDTIVLLYADAIGMGWNDFEKRMLWFSPVQIIVINGRRRVFVWDSVSKRMLRQRRFLAQAWWLEWFLAPWLLIVSSIYALTDTLLLHSKFRPSK